MHDDIKKQINDTRNILDKMLESSNDADEILKVSMQLDELISRYISVKAN